VRSVRLFRLGSDRFGADPHGNWTR